MRPPDEVKRDLVRRWLAKADEDLDAAKALLTHRDAFLAVVCFHAQQAAEKYLKAFLTWHQIEFPKTHDIGELLELVDCVDAQLSRSLSSGAALTAYGVEVRYPADTPELSEQEARDAMDLAENVRDAIAGTLDPGLMG